MSGSTGALPAPRARDATFALPVWTWLVLWMAAWVGGAGAAHHAVHGVINGWQLALSAFLAINVLICLWEISLGLRIGEIERWHHDEAGRRERPRGSVFLARVPPGALLSTWLWARIWSEYARYDPSYADRRSFGFAIDVGNGWSTLLPSLFFEVGMTAGMVSPVVLGLVGVVIFWQKLYGTGLYFFTFVFNRRYEGHPWGRLVGVVGGTNGVWLVFPALGLYVCLRLVLENRFDVIWS